MAIVMRHRRCETAWQRLRGSCSLRSWASHLQAYPPKPARRGRMLKAQMRQSQMHQPYPLSRTNEEAGLVLLPEEGRGLVPIVRFSATIGFGGRVLHAEAESMSPHRHLLLLVSVLSSGVCHLRAQETATDSAAKPALDLSGTWRVSRPVAPGFTPIMLVQAGTRLEADIVQHVRCAGRDVTMR